MPPTIPQGSGPLCPTLCSKYKFIYSPETLALRLGGEGFLCNPEGALGFPLCFVASVLGQKSLAKEQLCGWELSETEAFEWALGLGFISL